MSNKLVYEYAIIRYVPKVEREEFMNIGVLLFCKRKRFLQMRYQLNEVRLCSMYAQAPLNQLHAHMQAWAAVCKGAPEGGRIGEQEIGYRFRWLASNRSSIIQC